MNWRIECVGIIPCLNEARKVGSVIVAVRRHVDRVLVVDDGSTDATSSVAAEAGAEVLRHDSPRGKGAALLSGWRRARERGYHWAVILDGDGQHDPADIPAFFAAAERSGAALVVGNRMHCTVHMPPVRRWVNRWMSAQISRAAGCFLPDSQCGFRLMDLEAWSRLQIQSAHFEIETELLLAFAAAGHRLESVPIRVIYDDEHSKIHPLRDTIRWFRWWYLIRPQKVRARLAAA